MKRLFGEIKVIRLSKGFENIKNKRIKAVMPLAFLTAVILLWFIAKDKILNEVLLWIFDFILIVFSIIGTLLIISFLGTPLSAKRIEMCLSSIGFNDRFGETPLLLSRFRQAKAEVFEFYSPTVPITEYEKKRSDIETALNVRIVSIESGKDFQHVIIKAVTANKEFPQILMWENKYLSEKESILLLGESQLDKVMTDLKVTPHILIGGSSGSGKSVLLKLVLMQCVEKGFEIYIADFKGGVDFYGIWKRKCNIITQQEQLINRLESIVEELNSRKQLFIDCECANIEQYNKLTDCNFHRIVFACDEIAELLDKTGLDKESKVQIAKN